MTLVPDAVRAGVRVCLAVLATIGLQMTSAAQAADLAMGVIVKLKDPTRPASVVRLQVTDRPSDGSARQRLRLAHAAARSHVSYLVQKPTAFGAHVIHSGEVMSREAAEAMAERLRQDPDVEWAVVNEVVRPHAAGVQAVGVDVSNIKNIGSQWWLKSRADTANPGVAGFKDAWAVLKDEVVEPPVVAVLDTGVLNPVELDGRLLPGYDFVSGIDFARDGNGLDPDPSDPGDWLLAGQNTGVFDRCSVRESSSWHGLAITAMLAARTIGHDEVAGMLAPLPGAWVLPVRVSSVCGAEVSDIIEGMLWAAGVSYQGSPTTNPHPARIINMSMGGDGDCSLTAPRNSAAYLYAQTISYLRQKGVLVVAAAGNGREVSPGVRVGNPTPMRPASCPGVLAVTGLGQDGHKAAYANLVDDGRYPGVAVASGDPYGEYDSDNDHWIVSAGNLGTQGPDTSMSGFHATFRYSGTSFAAPQVAGVAAMMLAVSPTLTVDELIDKIRDSATPFPPADPGKLACSATETGRCNCTTSACGKGILNAEAAVLAAMAHAATVPTGTTFASPSVHSEFVPDRLRTRSGGGGGGGAVSALELFALLVMCAAMWRWRPTLSGDRR